ncbi:hypothetical protein VTK56DRAFT_2178 [Thermocarpiscus australiensis]
MQDANEYDRQFLPMLGNSDPDEEFLLRYRHTTLKTICRRSEDCEQRMEHEAGWNDMVHAPLLADALEGHSSVRFRNITACRIRDMFRDPDPSLGESKVDYGMFLNAPVVDGERLRSRLGNVPITHFGLSDEAPTPLAVSIETKSATADSLTGSTELASWVRAHLRHLEVVRESLRAMRGSAEDAHTLPLPTLPLVFARGHEWRVDIATRHNGKTFIYGSIAIGDSSSFAGCYRVSAAIRRLADWAAADLARWWSDALGG